MLKKILKENALSQVFSVLLVLMIVMSTISTILMWGLPYIEEQKMNTERTNALSDFYLLDDLVAELILDGPDSQGISRIGNSNEYAYVKVNGSNDKLIMSYCLNESFDFNVSDLLDGDDEFYINMSSVNEGPEWFGNDGWQYRRKITINNKTVIENLTNFPVKIYGTEPSIAQNDGGDIKFVQLDGSPMYHELEFFDSSDSSFRAWVKIPLLRDDKDTSFYMYYGNEGCPDQERPTEVWDDNYVLIQHLEETPDNDIKGHYDSNIDPANDENRGTPKNFNFTVNSTTDTTGAVDGADIFDGYDDTVVIDSNSELHNINRAFTIEACINIRNYNYIDNIIVSKDNQYNLSVIYDGSSKYNPYFGCNIGTSSSKTSYSSSDANVVKNRWYHISGVMDYTGYLSIFLNGENVTKESVFKSWPIVNPQDLTIGSFNQTGSFINGTIDEVRISNIGRSPTWIEMTNKTIRSSSFFSWGGRQSMGGEQIAWKAAVYWLNPSEDSGRFESVNYSHEKIYYDSLNSNDNWARQRFTALYNEQITKLQLNIKKQGLMESNLTVTLYDRNFNKLRYTEVFASNVTNEFSFVEVDFSFNPVSVVAGQYYYIVLNTDGGGIVYSGSDLINCYQWRLIPDELEFYSDSIAEISNNGGSSWIGASNDYNFDRKVFYSKHKNPKVKQFYPPDPYLYPGISYKFWIKAADQDDDPDDDLLSLRAIWDDGRITSWSGWVQNDSEKYFSYWYKKPGSYYPRVQVMDRDYNRNGIDKVYNVTILPPHEEARSAIIPEDIVREKREVYFHGNFIDISSEIDPESDFDPDLKGTFLIDIYSDSWPNFEDPTAPTTSQIPFGRVWVFDLGSLTFPRKYSMGNQKTIYQNGAIIDIKNNDFFIKKEPTFIETDDSIAFRIVQLKEGDISPETSSGLSSIKLLLDMKNSFSREPGFPDVYNLKLQFSGEFSDVWSSYFNESYDFRLHEEIADTVVYKHNGKTLLLDNSMFKIGLELV